MFYHSMLLHDKNLFIYGAAAGQSDEGYRAGGSAQHGGALYQGGGSGYVNPTYGIDPLTITYGQRSRRSPSNSICY